MISRTLASLALAGFVAAAAGCGTTGANPEARHQHLRDAKQGPAL